MYIRRNFFEYIVFYSRDIVINHYAYKKIWEDSLRTHKVEIETQQDHDMIVWTKQQIYNQQTHNKLRINEWSASLRGTGRTAKNAH